MGVQQVITGRRRDLGGFSVRRVLPAASVPMVGPFIFFDHLGPLALAPGAGIDVRPHPHIALATVTYLFSGSLLHRDSLGSVQTIRPGDVNWMTAGSGIVHSERSPEEERRRGVIAHGIQSWVALPDGHEEDAPDFQHHAAESLPCRSGEGVELRVIAGEAFGRASPVRLLSPTLYVDVSAAAGASLEIGADYSERACYVAAGGIEISGVRGAEGELLTLARGGAVTLRAERAARVILLGGEPFATPRFIWWNFVSSSRERIDSAKRQWAQGRFAPVPGESESMPLPPEAPTET
ncbi:MAG TPA: pirin family protein [Steroidobacteraceae bacterium]|jgi:redox-sensitive bicupin YhaK (pirin superfamily)|nr:pirin family protein [Steroidobacteraceae bacterium]